MPTSKKFAGFVLFFGFIYFVLAYIITLGSNMPLISPDEPRYAEIAREMIATGNWIVPKLLGMDYFEKPIMGHWMNALSEITFGYNNFAVRFSSALSVGLTALIIYILVKKESDYKIIASLSALMYLGFGLVYGVGTFAVLDSQVTLFVTGALAAFYAGWNSKSQFSLNFFLAVSGILAGCAFMTKGFLSFAVMFVTIVPFLLWQGEWKRLFTLCWVPLIFAVLISLPWAIAINNQAPDFWRYFFIVEHYERFMNAGSSSLENNFHQEPFWFFIPVLLGGMLPWAIHLPSVIRGYSRKYVFREPLFRYILCWVIMQTLFFSSSSGKIATYFLPIFPALSVLFAYGLYCCLESDRVKWIFDLTNKILAFAILLGGLGYFIFCILPYYYPKDVPALYHTFQSPLIALLYSMAAFMLLNYSWKARSTISKLLLFSLVPLVFFILRPHLTPDAVTSSGKAQGEFITSISNDISPETIIVAYPNMMHAVAWYLKRSDIYLWQNPGELAYAVEQPKNQYRLIPNEKSLQNLIEENKNNGGIATFMRGDYRESLPKEITPSQEKYQDGMMFAKFE